jgi:hypothetical protein
MFLSVLIVFAIAVLFAGFLGLLTEFLSRPKHTLPPPSETER